MNTVHADLEKGELTITTDGQQKSVPLASTEAFEAIGKLWLRVGWDNKYLYSMTWMGRPILQLPDDLIRLQEIVWAVEPDLIIETGVAHGGSLAFFASLLHVRGFGKVVGIEKGLMDSTKQAVIEHPLSSYMEVIEGGSTAAETVAAAKGFVKKSKKVMVFLDSNHSYQHVLDELNIYSQFVTPGSWLIACDGIIGDLKGAERINSDAATNNATEAVLTFLKSNPEFELLDPPLPFNQSSIRRSPTYWRGGFLRRRCH